MKLLSASRPAARSFSVAHPLKRGATSGVSRGRHYRQLKAAPGQVLDSAGEIFAYQHDPEAVGHDEYTLFDDESAGGPGLLPSSRVVTVQLDQATKVATLVKSVEQPEGFVAVAEGNAQTTRNGDLFVSWGLVPYISEFSPSGQLLFNAQFPGALTSYRAYRLPWRPAG